MGIFDIFMKQKENPIGNEENAINYPDLIRNYPWIIEENQDVVLSPDSDGLLCGLLMSNLLNWNIVGFYDGKILILKNGLSAKNCIFLDMEIFRKDVKSLGQHMVLFDKNKKPDKWNNFSECIQANNLRNYDFKNNFPLKYPFASIHLLLGILGSRKKIEIKKSAICPLLYTDGTFKNLFNYPENCLSWLNFLEANSKDNTLHEIFYNEHYSINSLMVSLKEFFEKLKKMNEDKRGADKIKISNAKGNPINLTKNKDLFSLDDKTRDMAKNFLELLADLTGWDYKGEKWLWNNFSVYKFKKESIKPSNGRYAELINKNPLSLAITSTLGIEYTLETPDKLP